MDCRRSFDAQKWKQIGSHSAGVATPKLKKSARTEDWAESRVELESKHLPAQNNQTGGGGEEKRAAMTKDGGNNDDDCGSADGDDGYFAY